MSLSGLHKAFLPRTQIFVQRITDMTSCELSNGNVNEILIVPREVQLEVVCCTYRAFSAMAGWFGSCVRFKYAARRNCSSMTRACSNNCNRCTESWNVIEYLLGISIFKSAVEGPWSKFKTIFCVNKCHTRVTG